MADGSQEPDEQRAGYVVFVTTPDREQAMAMARTVVAERLAACVNVLGEVRSIYRWPNNGQDELADEAEVLCLIKTTGARLEALRARIVALHSYQVPEVVALRIATGHAPYLAWLRDSVA